MFYNVIIATLERVVWIGDGIMDYKSIIIELLDRADDRLLRLIYCYVKALLGLG